jgi:arsenate reductase (thioredoxin)
MRILILCTGNSCRSQMAEAFLKSFDPDLEVYSAGTYPASCVHPKTVAVMHEVGIDLRGAFPKSVEKFLKQPFDYVITVCDDANETCPAFTGKVKKRVHLGFDDPARVTGPEQHVLGEFRRIRDEIEREFRSFYNRNITAEKNPSRN